MRVLVRALIVAAAINAPSVLAATASKMPRPAGSAPSMAVIGSPSWTAEGQPQGGAELGFSPLSVTQSGVAYSPVAAAPNPSDPATDDNATIADLPAWASSYFGEGRTRGHDDWLAAIGFNGFGDMSRPAAWALVMVGVALIGGALRGWIVANRRLKALRSDEHVDDD